jgi:hypothetical protein
VSRLAKEAGRDSRGTLGYDGAGLLVLKDDGV